MGFLAIFNIVQINNINAENARIEAQISQKESSLNELFNTYKELNNENKISEIVQNKNMTKIESSSKTNITLRDPKQYTKESNWFDSICNFFSSLFGGWYENKLFFVIYPQKAFDCYSFNSLYFFCIVW